MRTIVLMLVLFAAPTMAQEAPTREEAAVILVSAESGLREAGVSDEKAATIAKEGEEFKRKLRSFNLESVAAICAKRAHYETSPVDLARAMEEWAVGEETLLADYTKAVYSRLSAAEKDLFKLSMEGNSSVTIIDTPPDERPSACLLSGKVAPITMLNDICAR